MSILETIEAFNVVRNAYKVVRLSNFVENIINKESYEPARAFRDVLKVLRLHSPTACAILRTFKTLLVPINHEMHSRSYDFLYLFHLPKCTNSAILNTREFAICYVFDF